ncbi:MAG: hypothetical protein ABIN00_08095 [candidate division WOR-3 bacterium]
MNGNNFETILTQNLAALSMAVVFILYLVRKDKQNKETFDSFNQTIKNHLAHANKTEASLARSLQKLSDCISDLKEEVCKQK